MSGSRSSPTPLAYLDCGIAWAAKRDFDSAIAEYNVAMRLFPDCIEAYYYWRSIARKNGPCSKRTGPYVQKLIGA